MQRLLPLVVMCFAGFAPLLKGAEIIGTESRDRIPHEYIVKIKSPAFLAAADRARFAVEQAELFESRYGVAVATLYRHAFIGVAVKAGEEQIKALAGDPGVAWIEANRKVYASEAQENAPWGLDRIDSRQGLDKTYFYDATGKGVHAYIIDTGMRATHKEFTGRVGKGFSSVDDARGPADCNGHGTHVSATIGGTSYGVAKGVTLHPVRVLDCDGGGTIETVVSGIEWLIENAEFPAVANMSLGGGKSSALDEVVGAAIDKGIHFVVAAGNENSDACTTSPADVPAAITVGASTVSDQRAYFSNYGKCVDIFAPGVDIQSAWLTGDQATKTISGTSMASPHVAGAVALKLEKEPLLTPAGMALALAQDATLGKVVNPGLGSPNALLYTGGNSGEGP